MESLNNVLIIHATDADQHLGHLKKILDALKTERRIANYGTLESETVNENSLASLGNGDMVLTMLTNGLGPAKALIEEEMHKAQARLANTKMAEIIIDQIPYENQFIAFPSDLRPIRSREDMDGAWNQIGQTLRDIFPPQKEPEPPVAPVPWKKYLPYVLGALALGLLFWLIPPINDDDSGNALEILRLSTSVVPVESTPDNCPKQFDFNGTIEVNGPTEIVYTWLRSDGSGTPVDTLRFESAGEMEIPSSWVLGSEKKKYEEWQQLKIISPIDTVSNQAAIAFECKGEEPSTTTKVPDLNNATATAEVQGDTKVQVDCGKRHRFDFSGTIKANGKGTVNYVWIGNDGKTSATQSLTFQEAGTKSVRTSKTLRASSENGYEGWQQLKIVTPIESYSGVAKFVLACKKKEEAIAAQIKITALSPTSPKTLKVGDKVNFKFAYQTKWPGKVRIFGRPMTNGQVSKGYAAHGSTELSGSGGQESGFFTIKTAGVKVDQIRFQIWDADQKKLINETFVPVNYRFVAGSSTSSAVDVSFTNMGGTGSFSSGLFANKGIRRIKAAPSGSYCNDAQRVSLGQQGNTYLSTASPGNLNKCNTIPLSFEFSSGMKTVKIQFMGANTPYTLTAYGSTGSVIGRKSLNGNMTSKKTISFSSSSANIHRVVFGRQAALTKVYRITATK